MYWRFGHQNASVIDHLLESGNVSLEELLEQDDLIQECKAQNSKLIEYLRDPAVLQQLLNYITSDDLEDRARFKYPFIACEVIACEVWGIFESALSNIDMLVKFWEFLDRPPPLNPVQASYFAKVIGVFLMKKTSEMLQFIKSQPEVVPKLLLHMSTSAIMDLLLKIISMEESPEGKGTVQWLSEQGLMPWLVNRLDPNFDAEVHSIASQVLLDIIAISQSSHPEQPSIGTNVLIDELKSEVLVSQLVSFMLDRDAPYSSSTLINGVTIFIELIRRNNSDYDVEPLPPGSTEQVREAVDLSDLLKVLASRIEHFKNLLIVPRSVTGPTDTSIGKQTPLGFERLKICEMFAELLHCSNMAVLNSRPIISVSSDGTVQIPTVSIHGHHANEGVKSLGTDDVSKDKSIEESNSRKSTSLQNGARTPTESAVLIDDNQTTPRASPPPASSQPLPLEAGTSTLKSTIIASLGSPSLTQGDVMIPVGDFLKLQFVDHRIIPTCFDLFFQFPWNNFLHTVVYDMVHQVFHRPMGDIGRPDADGTYIPPRSDQDVTEGWNRRLTVSIFKDGQLTKRITDAQRLNDYECAQPKGVRLGYMGHLTYIADETVKLLELYSQTSLLSTLYEYIDLEDWWNYVSKILKETKDRDAQVLGGTRPNVAESHKSELDDGNDDDYMDENEDDYGNGNDFLGSSGGVGHEGDVASDQFARYLCQQITNNLPDKFGSSDEDEDDEDGSWIGEYGDNNEFDMRRAGVVPPDSLGDPFGSRLVEDFDSEDEEGVDEETWNAPWPSAPPFAENKTMEQEPTASTDLSTQQSATLRSSSDNVQDEFGEFKTADKIMAQHQQQKHGADDSTAVNSSSSTSPSEPTPAALPSAVTATPTSAHVVNPEATAINNITINDNFNANVKPMTKPSDAPVRNDEEAGEMAAHVPQPAPSSAPFDATSATSSNGESSNLGNSSNGTNTNKSSNSGHQGNESTGAFSKDVEIQPVAMAPVVQETPIAANVEKSTVESREHLPSSVSGVASNSSSNSVNSISSTTVEPPSPASSLGSNASTSTSSSALRPPSTTQTHPQLQPQNQEQGQELGTTMDKDVMPLADPTESKLHATLSSYPPPPNATSETTVAPAMVKGDQIDDNEMKGVTEKVGGLELKKGQEKRQTK